MFSEKEPLQFRKQPVFKAFLGILESFPGVSNILTHAEFYITAKLWRIKINKLYSHLD